MKNLNFLIIEGNLVRDPELKETDSGLPMCKFTLANNQDYKKDGALVKNVNYFDVVTWSRTAETCHQYLKKGSPVRVKGRLDQSSYKTEDDRRITVIDVIAQSVDFLPRNRKHDEAAQAQPEEAVAVA